MFWDVWLPQDDQHNVFSDLAEERKKWLTLKSLNFYGASDSLKSQANIAHTLDAMYSQSQYTEMGVERICLSYTADWILRSVMQCSTWSRLIQEITLYGVDLPFVLTVKECVSLKKLVLDGCFEEVSNLAQTLAPFFTSLPESLEHLSLDFNKLSFHQDTTDMRHLKDLKHLSLTGNRAGATFGDFIASLPATPSLKLLYLTDNEIEEHMFFDDVRSQLHAKLPNADIWLKPMRMEYVGETGNKVYVSDKESDAYLKQSQGKQSQETTALPVISSCELECFKLLKPLKLAQFAALTDLGLLGCHLGELHQSELKSIFDEFPCKCYHAEPAIQFHALEKQRAFSQTLEQIENFRCVLQLHALRHGRISQRVTRQC